MTAIIIAVVIGIIIGLIGGFYAGSFFIRKENQVVIQQNQMLQEYADRWSAMARNASLMNSEVAHQNTSNLQTTMGTVIQMLSVMQREQSHAINAEQETAINRIIEEAKSISPNSELD